MPQPGLSRAIPMGILGFAVGALLVLAIRAAQGLDPVWNPGVGMVLAAFFSAGFFVWGMGGFDPRMSAHGDEAHDEPQADVTPSPLALNSSITWKLTTLLIIVGLVIFVIAAVPFGPALTITEVPEASRVAVGYTDINLFGIEIPQVSQLTLFIAFIVVMMLSLFVLAGALGWVFFSTAKGVANAAVVEHTPMERQLFELPSGAGADAAQPKASGLPASLTIPVFLVVAIIGFVLTYFIIMPIVSGNILAGIIPIAEDTRLFFSIAAGLAAGAAIARLRGWWMFGAVFLAFAAFLYPIFYHVAIGLVYLAFPSIGPFTAELQRILLSIVNALIIPLIVLRPKWITFAAGRAARELAKFLRWVGTVR